MFTREFLLCLVTGSLFFVFSSYAKAGDIKIVKATYGDASAEKTCNATGAIAKLCDGLAACEFVIDDGICKVPSGAHVKNLEVTFDCNGKAKTVAGARDTKISLIKCP